MNANVLKNFFINHHSKNHPFDCSFIMNDSIFEIDDNQSFRIDNQINPNNFQIKESCLNEVNNVDLNHNQLLSNTTKPLVETNNCSKKDKVFDKCIVDYNFRNNNEQNNNLIDKESFPTLDSHESKKFSQHKKKRGRKSKKIYNSINDSNKFSNDNYIRKCKTLVLTYSLEFLNYQIKKIYNGNIGHGIHMKKLLDISQEYKADNTINYMRKFVKKTLCEIFSVGISRKYTSFLSNHNEIVIKRILNDKDDDIRKKFEKLFSLTFIDCLKKFVGENNFDEFDGFPLFDEVKLKLNEDSEHLEKIKETLINFEDIIKKIKPRNIKTKKVGFDTGFSGK